MNTDLLAHLLRNQDRYDRAELAALVACDWTLTGYLDWLTARDDDRADVLRMELRWRAGPSAPRPPELRAAIARVDREWWAGILSERVMNCGQALGKPPKVRFQLRCDRRWSDLTATGETGRRDCDSCARAVYWCPTVEEAEDKARRGECIAVPSHLVTGGARAHAVVGMPDYGRMWADRIF